MQALGWGFAQTSVLRGQLSSEASSASASRASSGRVGTVPPRSSFDTWGCVMWASLDSSVWEISSTDRRLVGDGAGGRSSRAAAARCSLIGDDVRPFVARL